MFFVYLNLINVFLFIFIVLFNVIYVHLIDEIGIQIHVNFFCLILGYSYLDHQMLKLLMNLAKKFLQGHHQFECILV